MTSYHACEFQHIIIYIGLLIVLSAIVMRYQAYSLFDAGNKIRTVFTRQVSADNFIQKENIRKMFD